MALFCAVVSIPDIRELVFGYSLSRVGDFNSDLISYGLLSDFYRLILARMVDGVIDEVIKRS